MHLVLEKYQRIGEKMQIKQKQMIGLCSLMGFLIRRLYHGLYITSMGICSLVFLGMV